MLNGIDPRVTPDLMACLMEMGHGDELAVVDANFPAASTAAKTVCGTPVYLPGFTAPSAIDLVTTLMPLDGFSDHCALYMEIDNEPDTLGKVHIEALEIINSVKPYGASAGSIERQDFYTRAAKAYGIVATTESRPFGCFILRKGVIL